MMARTGQERWALGGRFWWPVFLLVLVALAPGRALGAEVVLSGRVLDSGGRPVAGAEVGLYNSAHVRKPPDYLSNRTAADGRYRVAAPAGTYWAVAVLRRDGRRFGPLRTGDKHSGDPLEVELTADATQDFTVMDLKEAARAASKTNPELVAVRGVVVDTGGKPAAMAYVMADKNASFKDLPAYLSAWTGSGGRFVLYVPKGVYYLGASRSYPPAAVHLERKITVDGAEITDLRLVLAR